MQLEEIPGLELLKTPILRFTWHMARLCQVLFLERFCDMWTS